jgi:hypothetical protein
MTAMLARVRARALNVLALALLLGALALSPILGQPGTGIVHHTGSPLALKCLCE